MFQDQLPNVVVVECKEINSNAVEVYSSSGILFYKGYVLITAHLPSEVARIRLGDLCQEISPGTLHPISEFTDLSTLEFQIISKNSNDCKSEYPSYDVFPAQIIAVFKSQSVYESTNKILSTWTIDSQEKSDLNKICLSLFFVLSIRNDLNKVQIFKTLLQSMNNMWKTVNPEKIQVGQEVLIRSAPFGNRNFIDSHSRGIISNVLGKNSCFLFSDCPTVIGSEGSPMYATYG